MGGVEACVEDLDARLPAAGHDNEVRVQTDDSTRASDELLDGVLERHFLLERHFRVLAKSKPVLMAALTARTVIMCRASTAIAGVSAELA